MNDRGGKQKGPKTKKPNPSETLTEQSSSLSSSPEPLKDTRTLQTTAHREVNGQDLGRKQQQPQQGTDFEALFLRQVTAEFAEDIDKLREAKDFSDGTVPTLVENLRQGAALFGEEERKRIMANTGDREGKGANGSS